jgi:hypothetical protein
VECWLLAGPVALLARTGAGRALLAAAPDRATFHDPAASAHDLEAALGWPPPLAALVRRLPPGMALLRLNDRIEVSRSTLAPLMGHLLTGPTAQVWPRPTTVSA